MTEQEQQTMYQMVSEIYHHLGLDGQRPPSLDQIRKKAEKDVLKWREKQSKKKQ